MGRREHQLGFSTKKVLLAILVVAALAITGVAVYPRHKLGSVNNSAATSQTQSAALPQSATATQPAQTTTQYFTIKEWGVRSPYSGSLKLSYTISSDGKSAYFSSDQLAALSSDCVGKGGAIVRYSPTDFAGPYQQGQTVEQVATQNHSLYKHTGSYYYIFRHVQSGCGNVDSTAATQSQTNNAVQALVPNLQAIPK